MEESSNGDARPPDTALSSNGCGDAAPAAAERPVRGRAIGGSLYTPGVFPRSLPSAPPIYRVAGGGRRPQGNIDIDIRLRAAGSSKEMMQVVQEALPRFEMGNVVVAFTTAAKLDEGKEMASLEHSPAWPLLQEKVIESAPQLEPRGMSMVAYAAARLMWGDERLLEGLATSGVRRVSDFGATDVAKATWAFAKLRFVEEPAAREFWRVALPEAERAIRGARFVDVSMIAWAFAITRLGNNGLFAAVSAAVWAPAEPLPPRSLAGTCWSLAAARYQDQKPFREIARLARVCVSDFTAHDISAICWGFAMADAVDALLFEKLATHAVQRGLIRKLGPPLAAELAWGFAAAGVQHVGLFEELQQLCVAKILDLETEDVTSFAWAFATQRSVQALDAFRAILKYCERFAARLRPSDRRVIAWALDTAGLGPMPEVRRAEPRPPPVAGASAPAGVTSAPRLRC